MRARIRRGFALLLALAAAAPALILTTAAPAGASPVGYTLVTEVLELLEVGPEPDVDGAAEPEGDVGAQQFAECTLAQVDLATGTVTELSHTGEDACVDDLTMAPDGRIYGIQQQCEGELCEFDLDDLGSQEFGAETHLTGLEVHLIQFDPATGVPTDLGAINGPAALGPGLFFPSPLGFGGLTFDKDGNLYVEMVGDAPPCEGDAFCLYRVDPADLANPTFIGTGTPETFFQILAAGCGTPEAVTLSPGELLVGGAGEVDSLVFPIPGQDLIARDLTNGNTTVIGPTGENNAVAGMAFDSNGTLWGVGLVAPEGGGTPPQVVFTINTSTGLATPLVELSVSIEDAIVLGLALPLDCPEELVVRFTG
jgi:hypothetical protein